MAEDATGGFDPSSVNAGGDRGGKEIFDEVLGGKTPPNDKLMAYGQSLIIIIAPAVLFLILNYWFCCCCTCCHCCFKLCCPDKCHLCKCIPRTDREYTKLEGLLPVFVWIFFSLLMCGFAIAGKYNTKVVYIEMKEDTKILHFICFHVFMFINYLFIFFCTGIVQGVYKVNDARNFVTHVSVLLHGEMTMEEKRKQYALEHPDSETEEDEEEEEEEEERREKKRRKTSKQSKKKSKKRSKKNGKNKRERSSSSSSSSPVKKKKKKEGLPQKINKIY